VKRLLSITAPLVALVDRLSTWIGAGLRWLIFAAVLLSAGNAIVRKVFSTSSNALLEGQWYLFSAVFMLGAGYVFLHNAHVRIDFISARLSAKTRNWVDVGGIVFILLPTSLFVAWLSWPLLSSAFVSGEMSQNAGGLIRWPVLFTIPLGMGLLLLQALAELHKRLSFLFDIGPDPLAATGSKDVDLVKDDKELPT
jgi:TRAP-type mannitol/chloroaromatic compound transport system permease small subunit